MFVTLCTILSLNNIHCASQIVVGDLAGVSQPTVCRIILRVSRLIAALVGQFVTFPDTQADKLETMRAFYNLAHFAGMLGAVDCTHVPIQSPSGNNAELYRNRKGYFSVNVQAICTASLRFTNVVARWPGSVHDSTIFGNSRICARFELNQIPTGHLLGDAGYACKRYMLTPLAQTATVAETRYNFAQIRSRNPIEHSFGVSNGDFHAFT
jgi:hypothetical protein